MATTTVLATLLLDENIPRSVMTRLREVGVPFIDVASIAPGSSDETLLDWAHRERLIIVTGDLDFPRLIFGDHQPPPLALIVERRQPVEASRLTDDILRVLRLGNRLHGHVIVLDHDDERVRAFPLKRLH